MMPTWNEAGQTPFKIQPYQAVILSSSTCHCVFLYDWLGSHGHGPLLGLLVLPKTDAASPQKSFFATLLQMHPNHGI